MKNLMCHEFLVQNKIHQLIKYSLLFFGFCLISASVINSPEEIQKFGTLFSVIYIPIGFFNLAPSIFKSDVEDGSLECLLIATSSIKIILCKFLVLSLSVSTSFVIISPLIMVFFHLDIFALALLICNAALLLLLSAALTVLIASIQAYFKSNTNFLTILIMPFIIPSIILSGIFIQSMNETYLLAMLAGINLLLIPPSLYLSSYLVDNIYNI